MSFKLLNPGQTGAFRRGNPLALSPAPLAECTAFLLQSTMYSPDLVCGIMEQEKLQCRTV